MAAAEALRRRWAGLSFSAQNRLVGVVLALPSTAVLGIAAWLTPAAEGVGTHMQLGLGGCSVLTATGWPCPMCGMTTTFSHMAHLSPVEALHTQPFGVVLFLTTLLLASVGWADALLGGGRWRRLSAWVLAREVPVAVLTLLGMALGWVYKSMIIKGML